MIGLSGVGWPGTIFWPPAGTVILDALIFSLSDKWLDAGNKADWRTGAGGNRIFAARFDARHYRRNCLLMQSYKRHLMYQFVSVRAAAGGLCLLNRAAYSAWAQAVQLPDSGTASRSCA